MFSDMHELKMINDEVFLDRDGITFETLVNYLRNDRKVFPEFNDKKTEKNFFKELHFWGIPAHNRKKQEYYQTKWGHDRTDPDFGKPPGFGAPGFGGPGLGGPGLGGPSLSP